MSGQEKKKRKIKTSLSKSSLLLYFLSPKNFLQIKTLINNKRSDIITDVFFLCVTSYYKCTGAIIIERKKEKTKSFINICNAYNDTIPKNCDHIFGDREHLFSAHGKVVFFETHTHTQNKWDENVCFCQTKNRI